MNQEINIQPYTKAKGKLIEQLLYLKKREFSGKIIIKSAAKFAWTLYFYLGRLVCCENGHHGNRSWLRYLHQFCPKLDIDNLEIHIDQSHLKLFACHSYHILLSLCKSGLLRREQAIEVIKEQIKDALFDILQQENFGTLDYTVEAESSNSKLHFNLHEALTLINVEYILIQSYQDWVHWVEAGFEFWSPNFVPIIRRKETLRQIVSPSVYQNFTHFINSKSTLRDLAQTMNRDLILLTNSISTYIHQGIIGLIEIPDILLPNSIYRQKITVKTQKLVKNQSLVVCIDDSKQICQIMKEILSKASYDFVGINDAIQAIPTLITKTPDLIFLDIGMPIMNGYEVCTQIRRVSKLKNIPVVILTGKDGIIDRMRAKMVGASAFISKPIDEDEVLGLAQDLIINKLSDNKQNLMPSLNSQANVNVTCA